jgi:hypothetical protein
MVWRIDLNASGVVDPSGVVREVVMLPPFWVELKDNAPPRRIRNGTGLLQRFAESSLD